MRHLADRAGQGADGRRQAPNEKAAAGQARSRLHTEGRAYLASVSVPFMMAEWPGKEQK
jgi:hypothetical protein